MKISKLLKIILLTLIILILGQKFCFATVQMESKSGTTAWTDISVTSSFDECLKLNSEYSTLGTTNLNAHLSTDADWSAMAIFSASQFGGTTNNKPAQTNGNATGIYGLDKIGFYQVSGVCETVPNDNSYFESLLKVENSKYVKKYKYERLDNSSAWTKDVASGGTFGMLSSDKDWGPGNYGKSNYASLKVGLFGVHCLANSAGNGWYWGQGGPNCSFRPVLWN